MSILANTVGKHDTIIIVLGSALLRHKMLAVDHLLTLGTTDSMVLFRICLKTDWRIV